MLGSLEAGGFGFRLPTPRHLIEQYFVLNLATWNCARQIGHSRYTGVFLLDSATQALEQNLLCWEGYCSNFFPHFSQMVTFGFAVLAMLPPLFVPAFGDTIAYCNNECKRKMNNKLHKVIFFYRGWLSAG